MKYKVIKNIDQYNEYCNLHETLSVSCNDNVTEEIELLELLINDYDNRTMDKTISKLNPVELLRSLLSDFNLSQSKFADKINVSKQLISDVLNYRRKISKDLVIKLSKCFAMSQEAFSRDYDFPLTKTKSAKNEKIIHPIHKGSQSEIVKSVEIIKEIEVIKEVPVEVIKEKIIVKEVEVVKEVPVEVIREVPVEIIRKIEVVKQIDKDLIKTTIDKRGTAKEESQEFENTKYKIASDTKSVIGEKLNTYNSMSESKDTGKRKSSIKKDRDKLTIIAGIGPKIEFLLNKQGILTFSQLAEMRVNSLRIILDKGGTRFRMHNLKTWPKQAKIASKGDLKKLKEFQEKG